MYWIGMQNNECYKFITKGKQVIWRKYNKALSPFHEEGNEKKTHTQKGEQRKRKVVTENNLSNYSRKLYYSKFSFLFSFHFVKIFLSSKRLSFLFFWRLINLSFFSSLLLLLYFLFFVCISRSKLLCDCMSRSLSVDVFLFTLEDLSKKRKWKR